MKSQKKKHLLIICLCAGLLWASDSESYAQMPTAQTGSANAAHDAVSVGQEEADLSMDERRSLARNFLRRMKIGFARAKKFTKSKESQKIENILPEGEILLLLPVLSDFLRPDGAMMARVQNKELAVSLNDFTSILELPINIDIESKVAQGWYIREDLPFVMNKEEGFVETVLGRFELAENIVFEDRDVYVPLDALAEWIGFEFEPIIENQELKITSPYPLPMQEREARRKRTQSKKKIPDPVLPVGSEDYRMSGLPFVDISTDSRYDRRGDSSGAETRHRANIITSGDFLKGTLTTQSQIDNEENLRSVRANYKQESVHGDLLGPLKARRFELGDVIQTNLALSQGSGQELGARITNADSLRTYTSPQTNISGNATPGWDVELYRDNQFLSFQEIGDDGFYNFINVDLFQNDNNFRLIFHGPQGERSEESLFIPVDTTRLAETGGVYDISVTANGKNTYRKKLTLEDEDEGSVNVAALYEKPIGKSSSLLVGLVSNQENNERNNILHSGLSTTVLSALVNVDAAIDDEAETAAEVTVRRDFGKHEMNSSVEWRGEGFDELNTEADTVSSYRSRLNLRGPIPNGFGIKPRYSLNLQHTGTTDDENAFQATAGANTVWKGFNFNNSYTYKTDDDLPEDQISSVSSVTGRYGPARLRLLAEHEIKPDTGLTRIVADYNHHFSKTLDFDLDVSRTLDPSLTEATAQLNWQAKFARISPSIRYNSDNDLYAGLNTRFGIGYDPLAGEVKSTFRTITSNGGISALVFLDRNGDGQMNQDEEPLSDVVVHALQNGGRKMTDENGVAFYTNLRELRLTDVVVDEDSLLDPQWVSGFKGMSVLPREGYVAEIMFPIHLSGELDGTLYAQSESGTKYAPRNTRLHLYNAEGKIEQTAVTDLGGFYLFTRVPPGRYLLLVDQRDAKKFNFQRPKPQQIEIGYEGTIIYGNDIVAKGDAKDVPSTIVSDLNDYKALHPHIDFTNKNYDLTINLGEYNSQMLASIVWYRLQKQYSAILGDGQLMVPASVSVADKRSGKHTLRIGLPNASLENAYSRCRALVARNLQCQVEIFPAFMEQEFARTDGIRVQ